MRRRVVVALALACVVGDEAGAELYRFRGDDPMTIDRDDMPSPRPESRDLDDYYDVLENHFFPGGDDAVPRALNVNTVGEVPDSSWFANRIRDGKVDRAALLRGPDRTDGPAPGPWLVTGAKTQGITPGFQIQDTRGDRYLIKFDPPSNPEMATAAEVISTKLFHTLGYHVPQNQIVSITPSQLQVSPDATVRDVVGRKIAMSDELLQKLLARVAHRPDGTIRALASKYLPGRPIGPFLFHGTRGDDANDVFPHEHRRELRGYYVFCAWLNHDDSRAINTLDMFVGESPQGFVRHYLIDFGSTLGSGSVEMQSRRAGNEYFFEPLQIVKGLLGFGFWLRPWVQVEYPRHPSLGLFEADFFQPHEWRPEYPNVAFDHMDAEDAFWAAKRVMSFTSDDLRAVVELGRLSDPAAADYLVECLGRRRDKIGDHWLRGVSPLDRFVVVGDTLEFKDLLVEHGFETESGHWTARVDAYHNPTGVVTALSGPSAVDGLRVAIPSSVAQYDEGSHFRVALQGDSHGMDVFLRKDPTGLTVVGIDRRAPRTAARSGSRLFKATALKESRD